MGQIYIFGDEAGTMPTTDGAPPFVAATVSFFDGVPGPFSEGRDAQWLASVLVESGAVAFYGYVRPPAGYGKALAARHSKLQTMARIQRILTGKNARFIRAGRVSVTNHIWITCMLEATGQALVSSIMHGTVDSVSVVLDRRTLSVEDRNLLEFLVTTDGQRLRDVLNQLEAKYPSEARALAERVKVTRDDTSVSLSSDPGVDDSSSGLRLAHHLATLARWTLMHPDAPSLESVFAEAGCPLSTLDLSALVSRSISREAIDVWKRDTNLPEPEA